MSNIFKNPFGGVNAAVLTEDDILNYWCDPFSYHLFSNISKEDFFLAPMNFIFTGGRSSGKSMFLRFWSFEVQYKMAIKNSSTLLKELINNKGIGFYFRIDGARLKSLAGANIEQNHWQNLFVHYFEILIGRKFSELLLLLQLEMSISEETISLLMGDISLFLNVKIENIDQLIFYFDSRINEVDEYIGKVPFHSNQFKSSDKIFISNSILRKYSEIIQNRIREFEKINILILLDEYENFLEYQQKIINTMLRFSSSLIKFRIGMRLEGFRTYKMISDDDFIKEGREYNLIALEELINGGEKQYKKFLIEIAKRRLQAIPFFKENTNIKKILGDRENLENEAMTIINGDKHRIYDYYKDYVTKEDFEKISHFENPLIILLYCLWLKRGRSVEFILKAHSDVMNNINSEEKKKYINDYRLKYKLALTFLLSSIYRKKKLYYSFNTFAFLSSGIVGNFVELCRRTFAIAKWEDENFLKENYVIPPNVQSSAAYEFSSSERQQIARIEEFGGEISLLIDNLGNAFRKDHTDIALKYPETNQFVLKINAQDAKHYLKIFKMAIKWSVVQKKPFIQRDAPSGNLSEIFTINRILSPIYQISYRTRGGKSLIIDQDRFVGALSKKDFDLTKKDIRNSILDNEGDSLFSL